MTNAMPRIWLLGTDHRLQFKDRPYSERQHQAVAALLRDSARNFGITLVAEECSEEALRERNCASTAVQDVAKELEIEHCFCDPDRKQRNALGLEQENDIRVRSFFSSNNERAIRGEVESSLCQREKEWLRRLVELSNWPVLFVCGANHVESFTTKLQGHGIEVAVIATNWAPPE